jgi:predicted CXXCH cytochrome family protein
MNLHHSLAIVGVLLVSVVAWPQDSGENSAKHDLNGQRCIACHVPRPPSPPESQPGNTCDRKLLWDCELLTRTFQTYDAPMTSGNPAAPVLDETQVRMSSLLCASCHDGVATFTMSGTNGFRARNSSPTAKGLQNEHPIDVTHDPAKDPSLAALTVVSRQVKLFGDSSKVQCATCHNVHDSSDPKLLRLPNNNSALCLTCHL